MFARRVNKIYVEPIPNVDDEVRFLLLKCKDMVSFVNDTRLGLLDHHLVILYDTIRTMNSEIYREMKKGPNVDNVLKLKSQYDRLEYWLLEKKTPK